MNRLDDKAIGTKRTGGQGGRALAALTLATGLMGAGFAAIGSESQLSATGPVSFPVCYDFTCRTRETVTLSPSHWATVLEIFHASPASGRNERLIIQKAVGRMEQLSGFHTPTYRDLPRNYSAGDGSVSTLPGQMDCVDESLNTTTYLRVFEKRGLLKYHRVLPRAYRRALLNQHWAGQVEEIGTGERYVVDSWFFENGRQPYIIHADDWHDISPFWRSNLQSPGRDREQVSLSQKER